MSIITEKARFRQTLIVYAQKHGVTKAALRYNTNRQYIYRWMKRYDGTLQSLTDKSHRPHHHPNQHTQQELQLIMKMRQQEPNAGLIVFWVILTQNGYNRSITGLYRVLKRMGQMGVKLPNPKYVPKPYEQMRYPGERIQIDVKLVPDVCLPEGVHYYQYTAIDEFSRYRYLEAFTSQSNQSSALFVEHLLHAFPTAIHCIQTDNGPEFSSHTPQGKFSIFETVLQSHGIAHKFIKPFTPRHNGKVERSHRKDNEYFYATHHFAGLTDLSEQLTAYNDHYNNFPMRPLGWKSPKAVLMEAISST